MSIEAASHSARLNAPATSGPVIHPRWVRITHWINALAMFMMIGSGWQIYDASPLFDFLQFPPGLALGGWLAGALLWHFAAMWILVINGVVYVTLGFGPCSAISLPPCAGGSRMTISPSTIRCSGSFMPACSWPAS
jgi:thiosulfate reductase cytochrome b subunit